MPLNAVGHWTSIIYIVEVDEQKANLGSRCKITAYNNCVATLYTVLFCPATQGFGSINQSINQHSINLMQPN
jgi:hypothetical protein